MTNYAVLIGNSEFPREPSLRSLTCPAYDVDGLAAALTAEERGLFEIKNIVILKDNRRDEIEENLNRTLNKATKDDLFLLYYSGHGLTDNKNNLYLSTLNTSAELLPSTAVSFNQIYDWMNRFYCTKIIIILDCCYSGAAGNVFSKGDIISQLQTLNNKAKGTFLITASSNDQVAQEKNKGQYSLFTSHLIKGLETDEADKNENGLISIDELFRYVYEHVVTENPTQIPKRFLKNETGELFIGKSGVKRRNERAKKIEPYFYDLAKDKRIAHDILTDVLKIIAKPVKELSALEKEKDKLINEVFENQEAVDFVRKWDKLIDKSEPDNLKIKFILLIASFIVVSAIVFGIWKSVSDKPINPEPANIIAAEKQKQLAAEKAKKEADAKAEQQAALAKQQAETKRRNAIEQAKKILDRPDETQWAAAVKSLKENEPLDADAMYLLGGSYYHEKNYQEACQWFKKAKTAGAATKEWVEKAKELSKKAGCE